MEESGTSDAFEAELARRLPVAVNAIAAAAGTIPVLMLGKPGVGKSTTCAHEFGPLVCVDRNGVRLDAQAPVPGIRIHHGAAAGTVDPACVRWQDGTHSMLDVVGAGAGTWSIPDRSNSDATAASELVNAIVLRQALQASPTFKIAVLLQEVDLERSEQWDILVHVTNMVPDDAQLHACISLIVTKHTGYFCPDVSARLRNIVAEHPPSVPMQNPRVRRLVQFLADHRERIAVVPAPAPGAVGPYPFGPRDAVRASIRSVEAISGSSLQLSLSAAAELQLTRMLALHVTRIQVTCSDLAALSRTSVERVVSAATSGAPEVLAVLRTAAQATRRVLDGVLTDAAFIEDVSALCALPQLDGVGADKLALIVDTVRRLAYLRAIHPRTLLDTPQQKTWRLEFTGSATRLQQLADSPSTRVIKDVFQASGWDGEAWHNRGRRGWHEARNYQRFITTVTVFPVASGTETWHEIRDGPVSQGTVLWRTGRVNQRYDGRMDSLGGLRVQTVHP